ncbi:MAG: deoxyribodipyrimidine photo-lyase [Pseudomonadota bacterium]
MTKEGRPSLVWFRRDLRLADNPALSAAAAAGTVVPVFVLDPETEALGAAPKWRLGEGLRGLAAALEALGLRLILRRGRAAEVLADLAAETGAAGVHWNRLYDPAAIARDTEVKAALKTARLEAKSHAGHLLHEPWVPETKAGGFFRVYTPFWKAVRALDVPAPLPEPALAGPSDWPASDLLSDWALGAAMDRGAEVVSEFAVVGEAEARARLARFLAGPIADYAAARDRLDLPGTSGLSENLALGEISPRTVWHAARQAMEMGAAGAETFLKEVVWRDFAWHLLYHTPHIAERNWRAEWDAFPWRGDGPEAVRWRRGQTGEPVIDAAMRELYVTGRMHNRARMLVASYLTKHLITDWRVGLGWFAECLIDWDPASNAMGWQWAAGSGPDASPYFRIFNPATQAEKFDPAGAYRARWLNATGPNASTDARRFYEAIPRSWAMSPEDPAPAPLIDLKAGRERALTAYQDHTAARRAAQ